MGNKGKTLCARSPYADDVFIGRRFGARTVVAHAARLGSNYAWLVRCDCGKESRVVAHKLAKGLQGSCVACSITAQTGSLSLSWKGTANVPRTAYCNFKASADHRGIAWNIEIDDVEELFVVQGGKCALSGIPLRFRTGWRYKRFANASLDRIDNNLPYQRGNIQLVTSDVNFAKQQLSVADFINLCRSVVDYADRAENKPVPFDEVAQ